MENIIDVYTGQLRENIIVCIHWTTQGKHCMYTRDNPGKNINDNTWQRMENITVYIGQLMENITVYTGQLMENFTLYI